MTGDAEPPDAMRTEVDVGVHLSNGQRSRDPRSVPLLVGILRDDDVAAHAIMALGRLRPPGVRPAVTRMLDDPRALVRREARKALARLPA